MPDPQPRDITVLLGAWRAGDTAALEQLVEALYTELHRITFDEALPVMLEPGRDLVALDHALEALAAVAERKARVVEMRFFGGLSVEQSARALDVSVETVMRDWKVAKAWLLRELKVPSGPAAS